MRTLEITSREIILEDLFIVDLLSDPKDLSVSQFLLRCETSPNPSHSLIPPFSDNGTVAAGSTATQKVVKSRLYTYVKL